MIKLKDWFRKNEHIYINEKQTFYIEKVQWFMLFPQIIIFYDYAENNFGAITFEWLFWSASFENWE